MLPTASWARSFEEELISSISLAALWSRSSTVPSLSNEVPVLGEAGRAEDGVQVASLGADQLVHLVVVVEFVAPLITFICRWKLKIPTICESVLLKTVMSALATGAYCSSVRCSL